MIINNFFEANGPHVNHVSFRQCGGTPVFKFEMIGLIEEVISIFENDRLYKRSAQNDSLIHEPEGRLMTEV
jgi:hypothetical protein